MIQKKSSDRLDALLQVMDALRKPDGCPWDREQTTESLTPYILEEACELIDAIEEGQPEIILDELGDLLLQVVFQAQIFKEQKQFDFYDVSAGICEKLIRRHPHVFAREETSTPEAELDQQWDRIKKSEKTHNKSCLADHLPKHLPALQRAQKLVSKTSRDQSQQELPRMVRSLLGQSKDKTTTGNLRIDEESLGQTLFELVQLAQDSGLDAEAALRQTTRQIINELDNN